MSDETDVHGHHQRRSSGVSVLIPPGASNLRKPHAYAGPLALLCSPRILLKVVDAEARTSKQAHDNLSSPLSDIFVVRYVLLRVLTGNT